MAVVLLAIVSGPRAAATSVAVPSNDQAIVHALNRLTYGPRPGDVERVKKMGLERWIETQLNPQRIDDKALEARLQGLDTLMLDSQTIQHEISGPARAERRQRRGGSLDPPSEAMRRGREVMTDLQEAKLLRAVYSERQLEEVLVDFWFNHFNVFAGKGATRHYVGEYERDAIRPYVLGNFRDMLEATAKSPAMLFYLDNWLNMSPRPEQGRAPREARPRRARGINENYARELLELHTLGVDGGYTQNDIVEVARALTGWTMRPRQGTGSMFVPALHDRGEKTILGRTIRAGGGAEELDAVLDIVATHPSTARHIATKLATRFISDTPSKAIVDKAAARFTAARGDLREVVRTIVTSPEFVAADSYRTKVKTPLEFVASALRLTGAEIRTALPIARELRDMGMPLYMCQPPTGYDETSDTWVSAGALVSRMNFAVNLAKNEIRGTRLTLTEQETAALAIGAPEFQRQ